MIQGSCIVTRISSFFQIIHGASFMSGMAISFQRAKAIPFLCFCFLTIFAETDATDECFESRCHNILGPPIRFPFRIKARQPKRCAYNSGFDLYCDDRNQTVLELPSSVKVLVRSIDYKSQHITVSDPEGCLPKQLPYLTLSASPFQFSSYSTDFALFNCTGKSHRDAASTSMYFESWSNFSCLDGADSQVIAIQSLESIVYSPLLGCTRIYRILKAPEDAFYQNTGTVSLSWSTPSCGWCEVQGGRCIPKENTAGLELECVGLGIPDTHTGKLKKEVLEGAILGPTLFVLVVVAVYLFYVSDIERKSYKKIRKFLEDYKALKPARYSYADIKRITNQFKREFGQGSYGTVDEGRLSSEILVAVKVLNNLTGNGEEFINEMEAMCQIHHVNVVQLVGYCADGFRRALVYEYLPNGSLQKFISSADNKDLFLGWEKIQSIALGIAQGIEYLHQGCDKRILHFDIKPHNILLDHNFTPKISDFGLAKLCSKDQSIVSMTTIRGTMGYIAREVYSRNFGNVSYKSDIYSYGMVLLEMVGGKKITDLTTGNESQVYYPQWVYNILESNEEMRIHVEGEEDAKIAKKLSIVGLWCIQWHPANRPTMKAVVQMLEGDEGKLVVPPNPFASTTSTKQSMPKTGKLSVIFELE